MLDLGQEFFYRKPSCVDDAHAVLMTLSLSRHLKAALSSAKYHTQPTNTEYEIVRSGFFPILPTFLIYLIKKIGKKHHFFGFTLDQATMMRIASVDGGISASSYALVMCTFITSRRSILWGSFINTKMQQEEFDRKGVRLGCPRRVYASDRENNFDAI